jgi:hypothetical protein
MRVRVGPVFAQETARFELRFTCGDCVYHVARHGTCAHGWPDAEHRAAPELGPDPDARAEVSFCKEFELA